MGPNINAHPSYVISVLILCQIFSVPYPDWRVFFEVKRIGVICEHQLIGVPSVSEWKEVPQGRILEVFFWGVHHIVV